MRTRIDGEAGIRASGGDGCGGDGLRRVPVAGGEPQTLHHPVFEPGDLFFAP